MQAQFATYLKNWAVLNKVVMTLTETELEQLLAQEQSERARLRVMLRIYNRYSKMRSIREKKDMAAKAKG